MIGPGHLAKVCAISRPLASSQTSTASKLDASQAGALAMEARRELRKALDKALGRFIAVQQKAVAGRKRRPELAQRVEHRV